MSDIKAARPLSRPPLAPLRARLRRAQADEGARVRGGRGRRRPRGRGRARREGRAPASSSPRGVRPAGVVRVNGAGHGVVRGRPRGGRPSSSWTRSCCRRRRPRRSPALGAGRAARDRDRRDRAGRCGSPTRPRRAPRVAALMLGAVDLGAELGSSRARTASRSSTRARRSSSTRPRPGSGAPFDVVHLDIARRRRARGGGALRALARLPRQGLHPPRPGGGRQPRLRAERRRASPGRERVLEAARGRRARGARRGRRSTGRWSTCRSSSGRGGSWRKRKEERMTTDGAPAPKVWRGPLLRGLRRRRRVPEPPRPDGHRADNILFTVPDAEHEPDPLQRGARRAHAVRPDPRQQRLHARADHGHDRPGHERERRRQPRVDRHQAAEPRLRRRHALGGERDPRHARVEVEPGRRDRLDALPRDQPAAARS